MAIVTRTNVDSIKIQNLFRTASANMSSSMQKMDSGYKITSAKDDAAGSSISMRMKTRLSGDQVAEDNIQSANALLTIAEGAYDTVNDNLTRIRELVLQAKNDTCSTVEIEAMQDEVDTRIDEIDRISASTRYSAIDLFDGSLGENGATFQVGANKGKDNEITIGTDSKVFSKVTFSALTGGITKDGFDLLKISKREATSSSTSVGDFDEAIGKLDDAISEVASRKSTIGSTFNRLDTALNNMNIQYENLASANSLIEDADIASEASEYTQQSILQQVSTSLLASANSSPSIALSII